MFEDIFVSDNILLNAFVFIYLYWYLVVGVFIPAGYYIFLRIFTFPLITRKAHELVLFVTPESIRIQKITSRLTPFFVSKKNIYWFDEPCQDVDTLNKFHIYIEGINQNITFRGKHENKVHDLTKEMSIPKQVGSHKILLPIKLKQHMQRHFMIVIDSEGNIAKMASSKDRQPLRASFYHTLGIYIQKQIETEGKEIESGGSNYRLLQLNTQTVLQQIKHVSAYRYYSSFWAYQLSRRIMRTEKYWMSYLKGSIDPKVMMALVILIGAGAAIFLVFYMLGNPQAMLGPMP